MSQKIISKKDDVIKFLMELNSVLNNPLFDVEKDLDILGKKKNESPFDPFTTANTLIALEFDKRDVCEQLKLLKITNYYETFIDDMDTTLPPFYAFAKSIDDHDVYIKVKIRDKENHKVFCVSFHFARFPFREHLPFSK